MSGLALIIKQVGINDPITPKVILDELASLPPLLCLCIGEIFHPSHKTSNPEKRPLLSGILELLCHRGQRLLQELRKAPRPEVGIHHLARGSPEVEVIDDAGDVLEEVLLVVGIHLRYAGNELPALGCVRSVDGGDSTKDPEEVVHLDRAGDVAAADELIRVRGPGIYSRVSDIYTVYLG